jgi:hypothetical protein
MCFCMKVPEAYFIQKCVKCAFVWNEEHFIQKHISHTHISHTSVWNVWNEAHFIQKHISHTHTHTHTHTYTSVWNVWNEAHFTHFCMKCMKWNTFHTEAHFTHFCIKCIKWSTFHTEAHFTHFCMKCASFHTLPYEMYEMCFISHTSVWNVLQEMSPWNGASSALVTDYQNLQILRMKNIAWVRLLSLTDEQLRQQATCFSDIVPDLSSQQLTARAHRQQSSGKSNTKHH